MKFVEFSQGIDGTHFRVISSNEIYEFFEPENEDEEPEFQKCTSNIRWFQIDELGAGDENTRLLIKVEEESRFHLEFDPEELEVIIHGGILMGGNYEEITPKNNPTPSR